MNRPIQTAPTLLFAVVVWLGYFAFNYRQVNEPPRSSPPKPVAVLSDEATIPKSSIFLEGDRAIETLALTPEQLSPPVAVDPRTLQLLNEIERALVSSDESEGERAFAELLPALLSHDAGAVSTLAENWEQGPVRDELVRRLTLAWTAFDANAAVKWVARLPDAGERKRAASEACYQIAQTDPAGAIEVAEHFDLGRDNGKLEHLAQLWAAENFSAALEWIKARPTGQLRDQLLVRISFVQSQSDPAQAAGLVAGLITPGSLQDEAALAVLRQWALRDPAGAHAWSDLFPAGPLRERGQQELARLGQIQYAADSRN